MSGKKNHGKIFKAEILLVAMYSAAISLYRLCMACILFFPRWVHHIRMPSDTKYLIYYAEIWYTIKDGENYLGSTENGEPDTDGDADDVDATTDGSGQAPGSD